MVRHFVELFSLSPELAKNLLERALERKRRNLEEGRTTPLSGRMLGLLFEKPSLRTRVSFEAAICQLGGNAIFLNAKDVGLGTRETISDFARVLSQYVDVLAVRTFAHATVEALARHATVPVINALSDDEHPCQAMADMLTVIEERGYLEGTKLVFVGDGNNVACSLATASALLGVEFVLSCPPDYTFPEAFQAAFEKRFPKHALKIEPDPLRAVAGADVLYTDVWASMGQENQVEQRRRDFMPYQVNQKLMKAAGSKAIFLHCLPAHRGEEVSAEVLDGPQSRVIEQAANRLHFQKELLVWLLCGPPAVADQNKKNSGRAQARPR